MTFVIIYLCSLLVLVLLCQVLAVLLQVFVKQQLSLSHFLRVILLDFKKISFIFAAEFNFNVMKGTKVQNCYEVCVTGFMRPILVCAWDFAHAEHKALLHISKLETKDAHSIVSISFHSSIIN